MAADVLILIDQQKAMEHPKWGPRNNPDAERNIARLLAAWRERGRPNLRRAVGQLGGSDGAGGRQSRFQDHHRRRRLLVVRQARPPGPAEDAHQLTLALLSGEYAAVTTAEAVLAGKIA